MSSLLAASFFDQHFTSLLNGIALGMLIFIVALGLSLIFGLLDVLNLAHGSLYLLGTYLGLQLIEREGLPFLAAIPLVFLFGIGAGLVLSVFLRPIRGRGHLDQVLLTLGLAFVVGDLVALIWGLQSYTIGEPGFLRGSVDILGHLYPLYRVALIGAGLALFVATYLAFERTQLGAVLRASIEDPHMVSALGIDVHRVRLGVLATGTALATLAGVLGAPMLAVSGGVGNEVLLFALIVVVMGGLGSIAGAFVGSLILGQVQALGVDLVPEIASFALFGAMALILAVRPTGLFGKA